MIYLSNDEDYEIAYVLMEYINDQRKMEKNRLKSPEQGQRGEIPSDQLVIKNHFHLILFLKTFFKQEHEMSFLERTHSSTKSFK